MYIDYVRVYQRDDVENGVGCDPDTRPTADYIQKYVRARSVVGLLTDATLQTHQRVQRREPDDVGPGGIQLPAELTVRRLLGAPLIFFRLHLMTI